VALKGWLDVRSPTGITGVSHPRHQPSGMVAVNSRPWYDVARVIETAKAINTTDQRHRWLRRRNS
jgi:hypothetical protein